MPRDRILIWYSCGAASAAAAKLTLTRYSATHDVRVVCCDTRANEHPDNYRFSAQCSDWFGQRIEYLVHEKFKTVDDVFEGTRYMSGPAGARCTTELKKKLRQAYQLPDDIHVFGYTAEETKRSKDFEFHNPELRTIWILQQENFSKKRCKEFVTEAGIELPEMYSLGFKNNNCLGCVKASSPAYWNLVRQTSPEVFQRRCEQSRALGVRLVLIEHKPNVRIFLDELPVDYQPKNKRAAQMEDVSCGPECGSPVLDWDNLR